MSAVAVRETPMDRIHELVVAGEPLKAKQIWNEIKLTVTGRKNQIYRLDCIRMRLEFVIMQFSRSQDPVIREVATRLEENLNKFLRA